MKVFLQLKKFSLNRIKNDKKKKQKIKEVNMNNNTSLIKIRSHRDLITDKLRTDYSQLKDVLIENYDIEKANIIYSRICDNSQTKQVLSDVTNELTSSGNNVSEFVVGSELLYKAFHKLCAIPTESILYASGNCFGDSYTIERLIDLKLDQSKYGYAKANLEFSSQVLIGLEKYGSLFTCYFHAHPGRGINSNFPSSIDYANQDRLESGKYKTIGGIFSRDGYLRFFTDKLEYKIIISGKGVEYVSEGVYKLTEIS